MFRHWQTWVGIASAAGTASVFIATCIEGMRARDIALSTGIAFALFTAGALLFANLFDWIQDQVGPQKRSKDVLAALRTLERRGETSIAVRELANLWSAKTQEGKGGWAEWNSRLRDIRHAGNDHVIKAVSRSADGSVVVDSRVELASTIQFFETGAWREYFRRG